MSRTTTSTVVVTEETDASAQVTSTVLKLKLNKSQDESKKVKWSEETVDNEHMGRKKSKCCCVYVKPRAFDESDTDTSEDECENCSGHVEKKKSDKKPSVQSEEDKPGAESQSGS